MKILLIIIGYMTIGYVLEKIIEGVVGGDRTATMMFFWPIAVLTIIVTIIGELIVRIPKGIIENAKAKHDGKGSTDR